MVPPSRNQTRRGVLECRCLVHRHGISALCLGRTTEETPPEKREESWAQSELSDWDAVPSDLLSQPFFWLMFSHWTTNSVNCGCASHNNEKQGTAALLASPKPACLQWFQTQPSSSRASPCIARIERKSSQGKAEALKAFLYQQLVVWWKEPTLY